MINLTDRSTGISYSSIRGCHDRYQLIQWKDELQVAVTDIKLQLSEYEEKYNPELGHTSEGYTWFMKAQCSLKIKTKMMFFVDTQISKVNKTLKSIRIKAAAIEHEQYLKSKS